MSSNLTISLRWAQAWVWKSAAELQDYFLESRASTVSSIDWVMRVKVARPCWKKEAEASYRLAFGMLPDELMNVKSLELLPWVDQGKWCFGDWNSVNHTTGSLSPCFALFWCSSRKEEHVEAYCARSGCGELLYLPLTTLWWSEASATSPSCWTKKTWEPGCLTVAPVFWEAI